MTHERAVRYAAAAGLAFAGVWWAAAPRAQERAEEPSVWGAYTFGPTHAAMAAMRGRLQDVLDAFVTGDRAALAGHADAIVHELDEASRGFHAAPSDEREVWHEFQGVIEQARLMQRNAREGRYPQAHAAFAAMTSRCLACHEHWRTYGRLSGTGAR